MFCFSNRSVPGVGEDSERERAGQVLGAQGDQARIETRDKDCIRQDPEGSG
jgi:hypothetical protein